MQSRQSLTLRMAGERARRSIVPAVEAAVAAAIAWWVAHTVLGHAEPFFAPIAAAVALSTSQVQRARRSTQMIAGVMLGIGIGELIEPVAGHGMLAIGLAVLVSLIGAVTIGVGFVGEGMMFFNQAAAASILVIALHHSGTAGERVTDALVGGGVALVIGVGLFPADPLRLLWDAERDVLSSLLRILERCSPSTEMDRSMDAMEWQEAASHEVHRALSNLTQARSTARSVVRVAPRRLSMRPFVDREESRVRGMYLLASAVLSLMRAALEGGHRPDGRSPMCGAEVLAMQDAVAGLAAAPRPWTGDALAAAREMIERALAAPPPDQGPQGAVISAAARRVGLDVLRVLPAG